MPISWWQIDFRAAVLKHMGKVLMAEPAGEKKEARTPGPETPKFDKKRFLDEVKGVPCEPKAEKVPSEKPKVPR